LLDSIGELAAIFERASVVFMGGTLASRGGHNILEPAFFGKPIIVGPHMENFAEIASEFAAAGALVSSPDAASLGQAVRRVIESPGDAGRIGQQLALAKRGVVDRVAELVLQAAGEGVPETPRALLKPLSCLWAAGHRFNQGRNQSAARSLRTRVVSIGGLSLGGSGKSPIVAHLATRLPVPAILTRGYRRQQSREPLIVPRGTQAPIARTGDEAQMFVRRNIAHVGIGANRLQTGRMLEEQLSPNIFLLDDGFQHVRLRRDFDIVTILPEFG
jgi:hypothetical protein